MDDILINRRAYVRYSQLVPLMYPNFKTVRKDDPSFGYIQRPDQDVAYYLSKGEQPIKVQDKLKDLYRNHILLCPTPSGYCEVMLKDPGQYVTWIAGARGIRFNKALDAKLTKLAQENEEDFLQFCRMSIALKRWYKEAFYTKDKTYELYQAMLESKKDFLSVYFRMLEHTPAEVIFSSILTLINRVMTFDESKDEYSTSFYRNLVKKTKVQIQGHIKPALRQLMALDPIIPKDVRYLNFYLSLRT